MTDTDPWLLEAEAYGLRIERDALRVANTRLLEILRKYGWRPPAPHDAAKEVSPTGITPAANPTSGGNVEQDAAGEEPVLPKGVTLDGTGVYWKYYPGSKNMSGVSELWEPDELEAIAKSKRHRQRLQDKREKETVVTDEMVDAAVRRDAESRGCATKEEYREHIRDVVAAALPPGPSVVVPVELLDEIVHGSECYCYIYVGHAIDQKCGICRARAPLTAQMPQGEEG